MVTIVKPVENIVTLSIAASASETDTADIGDRMLVGIITPAAWTAAVLTFAMSPDGARNYYNVYDDATERQIASATIGATRLLALDPSDWLGMPLIKLRSGTAASPVTQDAARTFKLILGPRV